MSRLILRVIISVAASAALPASIKSAVLPPLSSSPGLDVVCMADVKPSSINWLWPNWIALGKVSVLAGDGEKRKSTILCDITARATTGNAWPDGTAARAPASVIVLAAEDDVGDIRP